MTKTLPSYLRVHRGPDRQPLADQSNASLDSVAQFWLDFSDTTGWQVDRRARRKSQPLNVVPTVRDVTMGSVGADETLVCGAATSETGPPATAIATVSKSAATALALSASRLTDELTNNREALRRQEMELAARASVIVGEAEQTRLGDRIDSLLADAMSACGCDAAAIYLLDDDTQVLKARAVFGLPPTALEQPPRPLRGCRGDLEAMVRGVVTVDDFAAASIDTWNCPESFAAGICAVIKSGDVPIGTLWLFAAETAEFGKAETAAARLAVRAVELALEQTSSEKLRHDKKQAKGTVRDVAMWQHQSMPIGANLGEHWRVDGMIESPQDWATGWHAWDILPDGTIMLAIAEAADRSMMGAMNATVARAALASHTGYRHSPAQLLGRVSDTLWQTNTGEQLVSMLYVRVDPETGEGEVASAGSLIAMIGNRYGYRPLVDGRSEPLNSHIDGRCVTESFRMMEGETLFAHTAGWITDGATQTLLGDGIRRSMEAGDPNPLAAIRRQLATLTLKNERGAVTLLRH